LSLLEERNSRVGVIDGVIAEDGMRLMVLLLTTNSGPLHPLPTRLDLKVVVGLAGVILHGGCIWLVHIWNGVILLGFHHRSCANSLEMLVTSSLEMLVLLDQQA